MAKYDICIVGGCGHVGLPLAILLAAAGKKVAIYDLHEESVKSVSQGKMPFREEGADDILKKVIGKNLSVFSDKSIIADSRYIIIVIGTPADRYLEPEFTKFKHLFEEIIHLIRDDQHIILRSTVFPGTTDKVRKHLRRLGKKTKISFCPERIMQGKAIEELRTLPQLIGAYDETSYKDAGKLFSSLTKDLVFITPLEAEMAKIFTNIWRYAQFAIANNFYQIATDHNIDFYKIYDAITHNYPRAKSFARAGFAAGPCLFKDTAHLVAYTGNTFFLGNAAILANEGLPNFIIKRLDDKYSIAGKTIGILGMAFKADIDDKRNSLSFKLKRMLEMEAKKVICSDPYIKQEGFVTEKELIKNSDIIVLGAPHKKYAGLKIGADKVVVDVWNFFGNGGLF